MRNSYVILFLILTFPIASYAYIDPGTGSALVYIITGMVASLFFVVKGVVYSLFDFFSGKRSKVEECHVAIHSEDPRYESTFLPIMHHLSIHNIEHTYFTMYPRPSTFEVLPKITKHKEISPGIIGYSFLNRLKAELLLTTTPQLDVMTFKRSKKVKHYCFVQHALGEAIYLRPFPYDFFDSVMCCGGILKENIQYLETLRHAKHKWLLDTGIPHYDELLKKKKDLRIKGQKKTILIAPSWGELSLFKNFGIEFVDSLTRNFNIIVRPHPQMKISQFDLFSKVLSLKNVEIDLNPTFDNSMARADLLISDFSGIIHEFAFIYEKPVIVASYEKNLEGFEGYHLYKRSKIAERCESFIVTILPGEFIKLEGTIDQIISNFSPEKVRRIRNELIFNFGNASNVAAKQVMEILECL